MRRTRSGLSTSSSFRPDKRFVCYCHGALDRQTEGGRACVLVPAALGCTCLGTAEVVLVGSLLLVYSMLRHFSSQVLIFFFGNFRVQKYQVPNWNNIAGTCPYEEKDDELLLLYRKHVLENYCFYLLYLKTNTCFLLLLLLILFIHFLNPLYPFLGHGDPRVCPGCCWTTARCCFYYLNENRHTT